MLVKSVSKKILAEDLTSMEKKRSKMQKRKKKLNDCICKMMKQIFDILHHDYFINDMLFRFSQFVK